MPNASTEYVLRIENLKAYYTSKKGLVRAVEDVSLDIRRGEVVGLFGESGAGKTSIALSIMGIFDEVSRYYASSSGNEENKRLWQLRDEARKKGITSKEVGIDLPGVEGHIWFEGRDLLAIDEEEFRKLRGDRITYIPQGTRKSLNPYTNIGTQTAETLWVHDEDDVLTERYVLRRVLEVLDLMDIGDVDIRRYQKPGQFSVGEDQRVLIAMALISNPTLMIADEPTTAVDVGVRRRILDALEIAKDELGLAMLLISNDQTVIAETADRVAVMSAGRIMEFGTAERVLNHPRHPFTRAFIMSNPTMEVIRRIREKGLRIRGIPGSPPDLTDPPSGCPFHPRCEYATDQCREEVPEFREVDTDYWIFCHRFEEIPDW